MQKEKVYIPVFSTNTNQPTNHLKPSSLFPHKNPLPKEIKIKTQVISVGLYPQRPNTIIRPPCYASHNH